LLHRNGNREDHGHVVCFRCYDGVVSNMDFYIDFARRAAFHLGIPCSGIARLPTRIQHITTIRGPFAHAKNKENYWRRTHKRQISIYDANAEVIEKWFELIQKEVVAGVGIKIERWTRYPAGFGKTMASQPGWEHYVPSSLMVFQSSKAIRKTKQPPANPSGQSQEWPDSKLDEEGQQPSTEAAPVGTDKLASDAFVETAPREASLGQKSGTSSVDSGAVPPS